MHVYSSTPDRRQKVSYGVIAAGIAAAIFLNLRWSIPWWIDVLGPSSLSALAWFLFNNFLWKVNVGYPWGTIPNFSGLWSGEVTASDVPAPVAVEILQTWTAFYLISRTPNSRSTSIMASISEVNREVRYEFISEESVVSGGMHGMGLLRFIETETLSGEYFMHGRTGCIWLKKWNGTRAAFELKHNWQHIRFTQ